MGHANREIETKLLIKGLTIDQVKQQLTNFLADQEPVIRFGSSIDTYWTLKDPDVKGDFLRVRERDGIRQITVKSKDRPEAGNLNRIEVDVDSTSSTHQIHRLIRLAHGKPAGVIQKTYWVWELESEYDTVCCYQVTEPAFGPIVVEIEARSEERRDALVKQVKRTLWEAKGPLPGICEAPGSLYEMFISKVVNPFKGGGTK